MENLELDPAELRSVAERLATEAADFVRRRREEVFSGEPQRESTGEAVRAKSTPTDPVTIVDTETERLLRDRLAELRPGEHVLGEEGGGSSDDSAGRPTWVVDPIDGTVNFVYGLPAYAVSVAVQVDGRSIAGAVANVVDGAVYSAARGHGAHVRRGSATVPLRASVVDDLSMSLVGTGFGYDPQLRRRQASVLAMLLPQVRDIRRLGFGGAGPVPGRRGPTRRVLRGQPQRMGLGGGRADRRRGGCTGAGAADGRARRRQGIGRRGRHRESAMRSPTRSPGRAAADPPKE